LDLEENHIFGLMTSPSLICWWTVW